MIRRIAAILAGAVLAIGIALVIGGAATAAFQLNGLEQADIAHPHAALPMGGILVFALGSLLGGIAGGYVAARFGQWAVGAWIVAAILALNALSTASLFANVGVVAIASVVAAVAGCWLGARFAAGGVRA